METYYFIEKNSVKKGPLKYSDLKSEYLNKNDLVWRNDSDVWKSASEYEELIDIIIAEPPLTPKEEKNIKINYEIKKDIVDDNIGKASITLNNKVIDEIPIYNSKRINNSEPWYQKLWDFLIFWK